jgi:hypothetical protein
MRRRSPSSPPPSQLHFADQGQREMSERREITRRPSTLSGTRATPRPHHEQRFDELGTHPDRPCTGDAARRRIMARDTSPALSADPGGVRAQQIELELPRSAGILPRSPNPS